MKTLNTLIKQYVLLLAIVIPCSLRASITGPTTLCEGLSATYLYSTSPAVATTTWTISTGTAGVDYSVTSNGLTATILWIHPGTYNLIANGSETLTITINANPVPLITSNNNIGCVIDVKELTGPPYQVIDHDPNCYRVCENSIATYQTAAHSGSSYIWSEVGGTSTTSTGATHTTHWGTAAGISSVIVTETNAGCSGSASVCVTGAVSPHAAIGSIPAASAGTIYTCAGIAIQFNNLSTILSTPSQPNHITSYNWDFGDGTTSSVQNPLHTYSASSGTGYYLVTLTVANQCGCEDVITVRVSVGSSGPEILCPTTKCHNDTATYYTTSTCSSYNWSITNGVFVPVPAPTDNTVHVVWGNGNSGPGQVTLSMPSCPGSCPTPTTVSIPILPANPSISGPLQVCAGQVYTYSVTMIPSTTYNWVITPSTAAVVFTQDYQTQIRVNASCTISVTMTNTFYHCSGTGDINVTVKQPFSLSSADGSTFCQNSSHTITSGGTGTGYATLQWHLEDNFGVTVSGSTASGPTYTYAYNTPGSYTVVAEDPTGFFCNNRASQGIVVNAAPAPLTAISPVSCICPGQLYTYSASATDPSSFLRWTATGAAGGTQQQIGGAITVTWSGVAPMSLDVSQVGANGCASPSYSTTISKCTLPSTATLDGDDPCENSLKTYKALSVSADQYQWSISPTDAGAVASSSGNQVDIQWHMIPAGATLPYTATITLVATKCGSTQTYTKTVTIASAPIPTITAGNLCNGQPLTFSTPTSGTSFTWSTNNGAGTSGTSSYSTSAGNSTHVVIGLSVGYACGGTASTVVNFAVAESPIVTIDPASAHICTTGGSVVLTPVVSNTTGTIGYLWSNGAITTTLTATALGTYTVSVTSGGCTTTASKVVDDDCSSGGTGGCTTYGGTAPTISTPSVSCNVGSFSASIPSGSPSVTWDFGDPLSGTNTASGNSASHTFSRAGIFTVTMTSTYSGYCPLSATTTVTINNQVAIKYGVSCSGAADVVTITNLSTSLSGTPSYTWSTSPSVSGVVSGSTYSVTPTVSTPSSISVTLTESASGCHTSQVIPLNYITAPTVTADATSGCADYPISLSIHSVPSNIASIVWKWPGTFASGSSVSFTAIGGKTVTIEAIDIYGCTHTGAGGSFTQTPNDVTAGISGNTTQCLGSTVTLTAAGSSAAGGLTYTWSDGPHSPSYIDNVLVNGNYTVTVKNSNDCIQTATAGVSFITVPTPPLEGPLEACIGDKLTYVTTNYGSSSGFTYQWSENSSIVSTGTDPTHVISLATSSVTVALNLIYTTGTHTCTSSPVSVATLVHTLPSTPTVGISGNRCLNVGPVSLAVSSPLTGGTYYWSNGLTGSTISVTDGGLYDVYFKDSYGCKSSTSALITVLPKIEFSRLITKCLFACKDNNPVVSMPNVAGTTYVWRMDSPSGAVVGTGYQFTPTTSGTYYLFIQNADHCQGTSGPFDIHFGDCGKCCKDGVLQITSISCTSPSPACIWKVALNYSNPNLATGDVVSISVMSGGTATTASYTAGGGATSHTFNMNVDSDSDTHQICFSLTYQPHGEGDVCYQNICTYVNCP